MEKRLGADRERRRAMEASAARPASGRLRRLVRRRGFQRHLRYENDASNVCHSNENMDGGNPMNEVRYGIIGIGNMGAGHASILTSGSINGAVLTAVCDGFESKREW